MMQDTDTFSYIKFYLDETFETPQYVIWPMYTSTVSSIYLPAAVENYHVIALLPTPSGGML